MSGDGDDALPPPRPQPDPVPFVEAAMIPHPSDTAALAKRLFPAGTRISLPPDLISTADGDATAEAAAAALPVLTLSSPCLEGHRFAVRPAPTGSPLLSWGLPFGHALRPIAPGEVLMNSAMERALRGRLVGDHGEDNDAIREFLDRTGGPNFEDLNVSPDAPFDLNGIEVEEVGMNRVTVEAEEDGAGTFPGYPRPFGRGVGTRNHVIVLALTASASPVIAPLARRWSSFEGIDPLTGRPPPNFDGVRVVTHTEGEANGSGSDGGSGGGQHNVEMVLRCLAGFLTHPNVGGAVVVTTGRERNVTERALMEFVSRHNAEAERGGGVPVYPPECFAPPFASWVRVRGGPPAAGAALDSPIASAVSHASRSGEVRVPCPLSDLNIALQCGGSDAFSGLTGNPLAGAAVGRLISSYGSRAILGESPELVGAEPYVLRNVSARGAAEEFIETTERYKRYGARHGQSVAGNPSGGNLYRGLYNIVLKSLGAARKKPPDIGLDCVLGYGEPMRGWNRDFWDEDPDVPANAPRYAFMDSPGNDLESIAGQVSCGSNLVIFITGNGALTNFPFVPTIKIVTTAKRYGLLSAEMDINAGPYGHGGDDRERSIADAVGLCRRVAGGEKSKGEQAGHSQVNIWRNWAVAEEGEEKKEDDGDVPRSRVVAKRAKLTEDSKKVTMDDTMALCSRIPPHPVRSDTPLDVSESLLNQPPVRRASSSEDGCVGDRNKRSALHTPLRPYSRGSSYALIPTSLCSSAISAQIADYVGDRFDEEEKKDKNGEGVMGEWAAKAKPHIVCPAHTEGCGAAGDVSYERTYQRLLLGHALHPSISRAFFLEHGE